MKITPPREDHAKILNRCHFGEALTVLRTLPDGLAQTCVTSPPYWGLRDYGTATWIGGDAACDHRGEPMRTRAKINQHCGTGADVKNAAGHQFYRERCERCGARREDEQLGLEATPEEYVAKVVAIFREVRRVLKPDGTLWLNLGDSYAGSRKDGYPNPETSGLEGGLTNQDQSRGVRAMRYTKGHSEREVPPVPRSDVLVAGLKPKDLVGIPWRVAFALQADGWYLRQEIIWAKPNPMPESVTDRCTKSHEQVFLLSPSSRYFFDSAGIQEPVVGAERDQAEALASRAAHDHKSAPGALHNGIRGRGPAQSFTGPKALATHPDRQTKRAAAPSTTRNKRSVWEVATVPYAGAHFATYPPALITPCILAGSRPGDVVLDPFLGSGTTAQVAQSLGREWVGIDLNPANAPLQAARAAQMGMAL